MTNVAGTGQCGCLAFYAALGNVTTGLMNPTTEVVAAAGELKRQVINTLLANLRDECLLRPEELEAEVKAVSKRCTASLTMEEKRCALAEHFVSQRKKSIKDAVSLTYWVWPSHIKAMSIHAREAIYVLDVKTCDEVRVQMYGYQDQRLGNGEAVEIGIIQPLATDAALRLFQDLVAAGTLPLVLVLRHSEAGNHFQAVTYDVEKYEEYTRHYDDYATIVIILWPSTGVAPSTPYLILMIG
ncbi:hypothetical protein PHMEG_0002740 [Phytophthora megakarya]|uniref:Uncharacterized protein n=1 Tax=Phytophthora megakarya TaxID=4795 RepID=A0A225X006_9STRA|nr:hypothetical protein PHMEG_0002740 [Phytophthora megakarya]